MHLPFFPLRLHTPVPADETLPLPLRQSHLSTPTTEHTSRQKNRPRWTQHLPFLGIFLIAFYMITINMTSPWRTIHEDNGTLNASIAINHLRYGLGYTKGQDILDREAKLSFGPQGSEENHFAWYWSDQVHPQVYGDHPPLLGLTIALSFLIFGEHFWSERLVPIVYALGGLVLFYNLVSRYWSIQIARFSAFLYATYPMFDYFGRNISHESEVLFWALLLLTLFLRWREHPHSVWLVLMGTTILIGGFYGWPMFYFSVLIWVIHDLMARRFTPTLCAALVIPAVLTFALVIGQLAWVNDGDMGKLITMFGHRTSGGSEDASVAFVTWFGQIIAWNAEGFGAWSQYLLPVVVIFLMARMQEEAGFPRVTISIILAVWGISHILIFRNGAYVHAYWQFYLLPIMALMPAWLLDSILAKTLRQRSLHTISYCCCGLVAWGLGLSPTLMLYTTGYHTLYPIQPLLDFWR